MIKQANPGTKATGQWGANGLSRSAHSKLGSNKPPSADTALSAKGLLLRAPSLGDSLCEGVGEAAVALSPRRAAGERTVTQHRPTGRVAAGAPAGGAWTAGRLAGGAWGAGGGIGSTPEEGGLPQDSPLEGGLDAQMRELTRLLNTAETPEKRAVVQAAIEALEAKARQESGAGEEYPQGACGGAALSIGSKTKALSVPLARPSSARRRSAPGLKAIPEEKPNHRPMRRPPSMAMCSLREAKEEEEKGNAAKRPAMHLEDSSVAHGGEYTRVDYARSNEPTGSGGSGSPPGSGGGGGAPPQNSGPASGSGSPPTETQAREQRLASLEMQQIVARNRNQVLELTEPFVSHVSATSACPSFPCENALQRGPEKFWVSSGMFPQSLCVVLRRRVAVQQVTATCHGADVVRLELHTTAGRPLSPAGQAAEGTMVLRAQGDYSGQGSARALSPSRPTHCFQIPEGYLADHITMVFERGKGNFCVVQGVTITAKL